MNHLKLLYFVTEDWYFCSHRLSLAVAARDAGFEVVIVTRIREHGEVIRRAGLTVIPFEIQRSGINPLREVFTLLRLVLLYRRVRPDLVHHVAMKPVIYGTFAARLSGVPRVVNALAGMGWLFSSPKGGAKGLKVFVRGMLAWLLRYGLALVQNPDDGHILTQMGMPSSRIRRIRGAGVDLKQFSPVPEPEGVPVVVLSARLLWDKGVGEFVEAARHLSQQGIVARFVLAGKPDEANPASIGMEQITQWVDAGFVEYHGWVDDMPSLLAHSHIVCMPSYYGEGIPKALIEAAAAGRPIVTTDMPGCREVVHDGENGLLVPPRDVSSLVAALKMLICDPALRQRMGTCGRSRAEQEFGLESVISQTFAIYEELCG